MCTGHPAFEARRRTIVCTRINRPTSEHTWVTPCKPPQYSSTATPVIFRRSQVHCQRWNCHQDTVVQCNNAAKPPGNGRPVLCLHVLTCIHGSQCRKPCRSRGPKLLVCSS